MRLRIEMEQEEDGRWIAAVPARPGEMVYGVIETDTIAKRQALSLRALADRLDDAEAVPHAI